jgi:loader and inhibitor of G40P protein
MQVDALKAVAVLAAAYPHARFSEATVDLWARMLGDIDPHSLALAVERLISTSKFCPSIAEVREAALGNAVAIGEASAGEAWAIVLDTISGTGWARAPTFKDPVVWRAVQCTSNWYDLCTSDVSDMPAHRARFQQAYEALQRKVRDGLLLPESLRAAIESSRRESERGTLGNDDPHAQISAQRAAALKMLGGFGRVVPPA